MSRSGSGHAETMPYHYRFPMVSVAADVVCFTVHPDDGLQVALVRRSWESDAFAGYWALPGGFLQAERDKTIIECAHRELREETGVQASHLELVDVFSDLDRDPRPERVLSVAFLAIIPAHDLALGPVPATDVTAARWFSYDRALQLDLAFDHRRIIEAGRARLAGKIGFGAREDEEPDLLFAFLPKRFSIKRAEQVMSDIKGVRPDRANFRKWIGRYVTQTGDTEPGRTRRAHLYERRHPEASAAVGASAPMSGAIELARAHGIEGVEMLIDGMREAPPAAAAFLEQLLETYGDHPEFAVNVTRVPDLRINHRRTGRVLLTLSWQVRNKAFACTALAAPSAIEAAGLDGLRPWNGKPHQSAFRIGVGSDDMRRLARVLAAGVAQLEG